MKLLFFLVVIFMVTGRDALTHLLMKRRIVPRNTCMNVVCLNHGTCMSPLDFPICHCIEGFTGDRCQCPVRVKPNFCPSSSNFNITCDKECDSDIDCPGNKKCCFTDCERVCTDQFVFDPCGPGACDNDGNCSAPADDPTCQCPDRFFGKRCQLESNPGTCPKDIRVRGVILCKNDLECKCDQKCCISKCGDSICTSVVAPPQAPPQTTCENILCPFGSECRYVAGCKTCPIKPQCMFPEENQEPGQAWAEDDEFCRNAGLGQVILLASAADDGSFFALKCPSLPETPTCKCPAGSQCVGDPASRSLCCKTPYVSIDKPGACPKQMSTAESTVCENDANCPGKKKCCSACGGKLCSEPELCGSEYCQTGDVCVDKEGYCSNKDQCYPTLVKKCVSKACASKCTYKQNCRNNSYGIECYPINNY